MKLLKSIAAASLLCASVLPSVSQAQAYPSRTINFIVPYTPGTTADVLARLLGAKLSQRWNVPVVVDNKTGASGIIGTDFVAKAQPDGYTILFPATSYGTLPAINPKLPFDPVKSFAPVSLLGTSAMTLVVSTKFPANNVRELIDQAKKQPGVINYASPGTGGSQHLAMELFKQEANINMLHVPYKGTAGALNDLIAGHVQASVVSLQSATPFVQKGSLRMVGVMSRQRVPTFPQVPTLAEAGFPDMQVETWYGVMAPAGTPPAVIAKLNAEINNLLTLPDIKEAMAKQGVDPAGGKPEKLGTLVRSELKLWTQVVTRGKIVAD
ncbi:MAG: Tripartite tricarboxylate transporter family receptor [Noviherbaspirillum sp.]|jgi:tripartite-type tricarboxylate transporter receptor subunit TctC|nr:Tripartite tricarboxylate transporter family receptor [Noviherbaspirillum sp.]MDB5794766.1 Tripartite tricarboxylate transporter family receptor [Noviherbaspirillum sp.]